MMVIDGTNKIFGRLGSRIAKELLKGETVVLINADKIVMSGSIEDISAYLLETVNAYSFYDALVYADTKGVVLASSDNKQPEENILNLYPEIKDEFEKAARKK